MPRQQYEYKVIAAPKTAQRKKGLKTSEDRFAHTIEGTFNEIAADGWEYVRADTLPCEERSGLTSKTSRFHTLLVFRRALPDLAAAPVLQNPVASEMTQTPQLPSDQITPASEQDAGRTPDVITVLRTMKGPRNTDDDTPAKAPPVLGTPRDDT